jgi:hypothetical protein
MRLDSEVRKTFNSRNERFRKGMAGSTSSNDVMEVSLAAFLHAVVLRAPFVVEQ